MIVARLKSRPEFTMLRSRMSLMDLGWRAFFADQLGDSDGPRQALRVVAIHRKGHVLSDGEREFSIHLGDSGTDARRKSDPR